MAMAVYVARLFANPLESGVKSVVDVSPDNAAGVQMVGKRILDHPISLSESRKGCAERKTLFQVSFTLRARFSPV